MEIAINSIRVESKGSTKRARYDFGDIQRLAESIKEYGLMHPAVVDKITDDPEGKQYVLIAGGRRIRAHVMLGLGSIKATLMEDTDAKERKAMELEENVVRKDLSWHEQIECLRQLHQLKQELYGTATNSAANVGWGARETAAAVGKSLGSVGNDLKLANDLRARPDLLERVKKLPKVAAKKVIDQLLEAEELRRRVDNKGIDISVELTLGNCLDLIDYIPDESIDCLITDPPFGNEGIVKYAASHGNTYNINGTNVSTSDTLIPLFEELIPKLRTKLKNGAHVYIFCGMGVMYTALLDILQRNLFLMDELPLIWYKQRASVMPKDFHYSSSYEAILFGHRGERIRRLWKPVSNVLIYPAIAPQLRIHPLQRPDDLLRLLIENSTSPGQLVLDCFAGSGSTLKVSRDLQRKAIGFELDPDNYERALAWLQSTNVRKE